MRQHDPQEITLPVWLLEDDSISAEMLRVYAKLKAKIALQDPELKIRSQLVARGLVRALSSNSVSSSHHTIATSSKNNNLDDSSQARGVVAATTSQNRDDSAAPKNIFSSDDALSKELLLVSARTGAPINNYKQAHTREESSTGRELNQLEKVKRKIRRFSVEDRRPFDEKWAEFIMSCRALHERSCLVVIRSYLRQKLEDRALATGIDIVLDEKDWDTQQRGYALQLYQQYPSWQTSDWEKAIDWFMQDDFWSNVIIDVKSLRKNINRFVIWKQRKEPQKEKFAAVKVIGRKK